MAISITNAGAFLKDKDGNVGKVVGLSANDVTLVNNTISSVAGLDTRVTDAVNSIASVKETADAAKTAADAAKTAADDAKSTAEAAQTTANAASATAANANTTANEALYSAGNALSKASEVETALQATKTSINATLSEHEQTIERVDSQLTTTDASVTSLKNFDEQIYWPLIKKNQSMVSTVAMEKKDESTGVTTYWPIYATTATYGSSRLMQYDEDDELNNDVVTRALYTALEARVKALESKSSN